MQAGYRIARARPEWLGALPAVERAAAVLFEEIGIPEVALADSTSPEEFREAFEDGHLWVALAPDGRPVGFAMVEPLDGAAHLEEIDVHPDHGRRGLGAALVRTVCDWARESGLPAVTLTTFRGVPWNAPFYAKLGFRELDRAKWTPSLARIVGEEAGRGLEPERRMVMRRDCD